MNVGPRLLERHGKCYFITWALCCSVLQYAPVRCALPLSIGVVHLRAWPEEVVLAQSIRVNICPVLITQALITLALVIVAAVGAFAPRLPHALHPPALEPTSTQKAQERRMSPAYPCHSPYPLPLVGNQRSSDECSARSQPAATIEDGRGRRSASLCKGVWEIAHRAGVGCHLLRDAARTNHHARSGIQS